jgi:hypothetical protein
MKDYFTSRNAISRLRDKGQAFCDQLRNRCEAWEQGVAIARKLSNEWVAEYHSDSGASVAEMATDFLAAQDAMVAAVFTIADS